MYDKAEIREKNKQLRKSMSLDETKRLSDISSEIFLSSVFFKNASCIMLYMPLGNETDTSEIISRAFEEKKRVVFPITDNVSGVITPFYADENTLFEKGSFSVLEPRSNIAADISEIDVVLVPGIAFDMSGSRVGFGKGCYDKLLKNTDAIKIGYCYSFQLCEKIKSDKYDVRMDYIITENGIIKC